MNTENVTLAANLFGAVIPYAIYSVLTILSLVFLSKFIKKSEFKFAKEIYFSVGSFLAFQILTNLGAFFKTILNTIYNEIYKSALSSTNIAAAQSSFTNVKNVMTILNDYNLLFFVSLAITIVLFFLFAPKAENVLVEKEIGTVVETNEEATELESSED